MKNHKKILYLFILSIFIIPSSILMVNAKNVDSYLISLGNQQEDIEESIIVENIDKLKNFEPWDWIDNHRILGVFNQPVFSHEGNIGKMGIYDIDLKMIQILDESKSYGSSLMPSGGIINNKWFLYRDEWTYRNHPNYSKLIKLSVYNIIDNESLLCSENVTAYNLNKDENSIIWAENVDIYRFTEENHNEKIDIPNEIIQKLKDFSEFKLEDYLLKNNDNTVEEYNYYKNKNVIKHIGLNNDNLYLEGINGCFVIYNIKSKEYQWLNDSEKKQYKKSLDISKKVYEKFELISDDNEKVLWKTFKDGTLDKIIDVGKIRIRAVSKDENYIAYLKIIGNSERRFFIYDLNEECCSEIFAPEASYSKWNDNGSYLFVEGEDFIKGKPSNYYSTTYVVKMK